jgi:hypothetical protein
MNRVYFKSFGRDNFGGPLSTFVFNPTERTSSTFQTLREVLDQRVLRTNTRHPLLNARLSVSVPMNDFPGVYRPEGILFTTKQTPDYCTPFDLMALTSGRTLTSEDYGSNFLPGYEKFVFPEVESMTAAFPNSQAALDALNMLREAHGLDRVHEDKSYNEICFEKDVRFKPVALVGDSPEIVRIGLERKLPIYASVLGHLMNLSHQIHHPIKRFRELIQLGLSSMFDGYSGLAWEGGA